jgi:hypothetical protein
MVWLPTVPPPSRTAWRPSALAPLAMATDAIYSSLTKVASFDTKAHHPSIGRNDVDRTRRHAVSQFTRIGEPLAQRASRPEDIRSLRRKWFVSGASAGT